MVEKKWLHALFAAGLLLGASTLFGATEVEPVEIDEWTGSLNRLAETDLGGEDEFILKVTGSALLYSKDVLNVEPGKRYKLTGEFKATPESLPGLLYFGVMPLDADGKQILPAHVHVASGTETELAAPVKPSDQLIRVKNGGNWRESPLRCIAFDIDTTGNFKDLPNRNVTPHGVEKITPLADGTSEVLLSKPAGVMFPAGTAIRQHEIAGEYSYSAASGVTIPKEWTQYEAVISGELPYGVDNRKKWWRGTRGARIIALVNHTGDVGHVALMKNIKIAPMEE